MSFAFEEFVKKAYCCYSKALTSEVELVLVGSEAPLYTSPITKSIPQ